MDAQSKYNQCHKTAGNSIHPGGEHGISTAKGIQQACLQAQQRHECASMTNIPLRNQKQGFLTSGLDHPTDGGEYLIKSVRCHGIDQKAGIAFSSGSVNQQNNRTGQGMVE